MYDARCEPSHQPLIVLAYSYQAVGAQCRSSLTPEPWDVYCQTRARSRDDQGQVLTGVRLALLGSAPDVFDL